MGQLSGRVVVRSSSPPATARSFHVYASRTIPTTTALRSSPVSHRRRVTVYCSGPTPIVRGRRVMRAGKGCCATSVGTRFAATRSRVAAIIDVSGRGESARRSGAGGKSR